MSFRQRLRAEALASIERKECHAVLLGHSLSPSSRRKLAQAARKHCPGAHIVEIANRKLEKPEFADAFVYGVEGPEVLIAALRRGRKG